MGITLMVMLGIAIVNQLLNAVKNGVTLEENL